MAPKKNKLPLGKGAGSSKGKEDQRARQPSQKALAPTKLRKREASQEEQVEAEGLKLGQARENVTSTKGEQGFRRGRDTRGGCTCPQFHAQQAGEHKSMIQTQNCFEQCQ